MWIRCNPNPRRKEVPDCVIRAIAIALKRTWYEIYDDLCLLGREEADVPNDGPVWGLYLKRMGFRPFLLPESCPSCVTIRAFCEMFPTGTYIIGTGSHAVTVIGGNYYDSWDSGDEVPSFFWEKPTRMKEDERMSQYATKDDMAAIRNEIGSLKQMLGQNRQNGRNPSQGMGKDGGDNA